MGTIKHHDGEKWQIDGAGNARNISLENELLLDPQTTTISVERGFQKVNNKISKLEHNLAWLYLNGAKGGGGSGGSGTGVSYTIQIENDQSTFYTTSESLSLRVQIEAGGIRKQFKMYAQNLTNNQYLIAGSQSIYSQSYNTIVLEGLTQDCTVALWGVDSNDNYTSQITIQVKVGAINVQQVAQPGSIFYIGETTSMYGTFSIRNKTGNPVILALFNSSNNDPLAKGETPIWTSEISASANQFANYQVKYSDFIDQSILNKTYTFKVCVYSTYISNGNDEYLRSEYFTNSIQTASGNNLTIITSSIALTPESAQEYTFPQGGVCRIPVVFSYRYVTVNTFYYKYKVYHVLNGTETKVYQSSVSTVTRNTSTSIQFQLEGLGSLEGYYKVVIEGNNYQNFTGQLSAQSIVYFTLSEADTDNFRNYKGALIFNYGAFNQPDTNSQKCSYTIANEGTYGVNESQFPRSQGINKVDLTLHNSTNSTGFKFINSTGVNYIDLSGNTYATIDQFEQMLGFTDDYQYTLLGNGFYFQFTYKFTQSNPSGQTVLSLGTYDEGNLTNGLEVSSDHILMKVGSLQEEIEAPIKGENQYQNSIQGVTDQITVAFNCWKSDVVTISGDSIPTYYFALYLDGIMTKCLVVPEQELGANWAFGDKLYLGCRGDLTQQANCQIYDIRFYVQKQTPLSIVYNFISAIEQCNLTSEGLVDVTLDSNLRKKNFFSNSTDTCLLCDENGEYMTPAEILNTLSQSYNTYDLDYPIIYIEETSTTSEMYRIVKSTNWTKDSTEIKSSWPVRMHIFTKYGELIVDGDNDLERPNISIQGTSTLAYNIKNFEIKMGSQADGSDRLLKVNGWLPENEFTLKADVVDSSHSNNVVLGKWINESGYFSNMNSIDNEMKSQDANIANKRKLTSEGFPCLVFIKYANNGSGAIESNGISTGKTDFYGVYNFNLGRYAYHNLNLKILDSYEQDSSLPEDQPQIVTNYTIRQKPAKNIYSLEVEDNFGDDWALFQQANQSITEFMLSNRSYGDPNNQAYSCITDTLFTQLAQSYNGQLIPKKAIDANGEAYNLTDASGNIVYWSQLDNNAFNKIGLGETLNVECLYKYLVTALVFGMVDSTCKNMVFRTWDAVQSGNTWKATWYMCFYDMDSSMKLNNAGSEIVPYDAHLNKYYNISSGNITSAGDSRTTGVDWNVAVDASTSLKTYGGINGNRLWDIIRRFEQSATSTDTTLVGDYYWELRKLVPDAEKFIDDNFAAYINKTGAILYNYDYEQKYVSYGQVWDASKQQLVSNTSNKQVSFLYGTRLNSIRTWFKKRINFLDSVYQERYSTHSEELNSAGISLSGYFTSSWGARQTTPYTQTSLNITGAQKYKVRYTVSSGGTRTFWVSEEPQLITMATQANSNNTVTLEGFDGVTEIPQFYNLGFVGITQAYKFESLKGLYNNNLALDGLLGNNNLSECPSLTEVSFKGVQATESVSLDLSSNLSLRKVDISESNIASLVLSTNGSVTDINMTNASSIKNLPNTVNGQSGLKNLNLFGTSISNLVLQDLPSLEVLTLPTTVQSLTIQNCNIKRLSIVWSTTQTLSTLTSISISDCDSLEELDISGQNNLNTLILLRCPNIKSLNISKIKTPSAITIDLANLHDGVGCQLDGLTKLESLNISETDIFRDLDLRASNNLNSLICTLCSTLNSVTCAKNYIDGSSVGQDNPIELRNSSFQECSQLKYLKGYFSILGGRVFYKCSSLEFDNLLKEEDLILISRSSVLDYTFFGCSKFTSGQLALDFIHNVPANQVSSMAYMFANSGISVELSSSQWVFEAPNKYNTLTNIQYMFAYTSIRGSVFSEDETHAGFFTYIPNVMNIEGLFSNTSVQYIDNDIFHFSAMQNITDMDQVFYGCARLQCIKKCINGDSDKFTEPLHSRTLFNKVTTKVGNSHGEYIGNALDSQLKANWIWPQNVFYGTNLELNVDLDQNNKPYLFNTSSQEYQNRIMYIDGSVYAGLTFRIDCDNCDYFSMFKPGTRTSESEIQYIPKFVRITSPFQGTSGMIINFNNTKESFFDSSIVSLYDPFKGVSLYDPTTLPITFFKNCKSLVTAQNVFSGLLNNVYSDINYVTGVTVPFCTRTFIDTNEVFEFVKDGQGFFDSCESLKDISGIFSYNPNFRMRLSSEMFKNCKLTSVASAFKGSRVIETIPEKLFYCSNSCNISDMSDVFDKCYNIGYDENYEYGIYYLPRSQWSSWDSHVVISGSKLEQNPLPYDLFHYCSQNPVISNVLSQLFWKENIVEEGDANYQLKQTNTIIGLTGKISENIFNGTNIKNSTSLSYVFAGTYFDPYEDYIDKSYVRKNLYPNIFRYTPYLEEVVGMFVGTIIPNTHHINSDLFKDQDGNTLPIKNLSYCWYNCQFDPFILQGATDSSGNLIDAGSSQLESYEMFNKMSKLQDISYIFAGIQGTTTGLRWPDQTMFGFDTFESAYINITGAFSYINITTGKTIPIFNSLPGNVGIVGGASYLTGVQKASVGNAAYIPVGLQPQSWLE